MADIPKSGEPAARRTLRLALGVTAGFVVGQFGGWPLAFLTAPFTAILLIDPEPLPPRQGWRVLLLVGGFLLSGFLLTIVLYPWPAALALCMAVVLYNLLRFLVTAQEPLLVIVAALLGFAIVPVVVVLFPLLGLMGAMAFFIDFAFALLIAWLTWFFLPPTSPAPDTHYHGDAMSDTEVRTLTVTLVAVIWPLVVFFMATGTTKILVLVYAVLFAAQTGTAAGAREMGQTSLLANGVLAGLAMILCHELLVVMPSPFLMPLVALAAVLVFGQQIFNGSHASGTWLSALFGFLIMLGGALTKDAVDPSGTVFDRLWQLLLATVYVMFAFSVIEVFRTLTRSKEKTQHV